MPFATLFIAKTLPSSPLNSFSLLLFLLALTACKTPQATFNYESESLKMGQLTKSTFLHTSYLQTESFGKVPCNGMVVMNNGEAVIYDTPANEAASKELLHWVENSLKCKVSAVVVTHFHVDCLGGLAEFHKRGIPSYDNRLTIDLAKADGANLPQNGFEKYLELPVGNRKVTTEYIGEGHTKDNVVGYFPSEKVLFGGCLIKAVGAGKGNLEDANTDAWSETVRQVQSKYKEAEIVIPGHGKYGGPELLTYTIKMFGKD